MVKTCNKCGAEKTLEEYHKDKTKKYGVKNICKSCQKEYSRNYNIIERQKVSEKQKIYYTNKRQEILEKKKIYRDRSKNARSMYNKSYYKKNRSSVLENRRIYVFNNIETVREYGKKYRQARFYTCNSINMINRMGLMKRDIPEELFALMELNQRLKRLVRNRRKGV